MNSLPLWDLSGLYSGISDPRIMRALQEAQSDARKFSKRYRGNLLRFAKTPAKFLRVLREYEGLLQHATKPAIYAQLKFTENSINPELGAFQQKVKGEYKKVQHEIIFFELEAMALPTAVLRGLINAAALKKYSHYLTQLLACKKHRLSESEERLLNDKDLTGRSAFVRLFSEEHAAKEFSILSSKQIKTMTQSEALDLMHHPDRNMRKAAALGLSQGFKSEARRLTFITNALVQDKMIDDRYRKFESPEASRHLDNQIDQEMVDAMTTAVSQSYTLVQDFYRFKRRVLGLKELYDYDRYAPVSRSNFNIPFPEAKRMVLGAFGRFSKEYRDIAALFFSERWIDARPRKGKRGGAYCSFVTPDHHPYVFLNYFGGLREVFTLAHELGHAVHAYLMREAGYLNFDVPLTVAETASVFAEMLLFDFIREQTTDKKRLFDLYVKKIESVFATVFRQVALYRFEQDLHRECGEKGELTFEAISALWRNRQQEMFGTAMRLSPGYDYWWSYIPHFVHTPFYVYAYAFGELLTLSLYAQYHREGTKFVGKYMALLSAGGSKSPGALLKPFGINLRNKRFWQEGIGLIRNLVDQAKVMHG